MQVRVAHTKYALPTGSACMDGDYKSGYYKYMGGWCVGRVDKSSGLEVDAQKSHQI
jgi:hypothetical protein